MALPAGGDEAAAIPTSACVAVALSGGRDSTVLLHVALRCAEPLGLRVVALHVHHGLMAEADRWLDHVRQQCGRWARAGRPLEFQSRRLQGAPSPGQSVEAWARRERYRALADMAREAGATLVLLAHHRRDQAETVLLQALRGAGPAGLSAMPRIAEREGVLWARPWLDIDANDIAGYAKRWGLSFVEDSSNFDARFARSRLRQAVWPELLNAFPDAEQCLGAVAARAQEARAALAEMTAADLAALTDPQDTDALCLQAWLGWSEARQRLCLRAWLGSRLPQGVPETLLARLVNELPRARSAQWPAGPGWQLKLYRARLRFAQCATQPQRARNAGIEAPPRRMINVSQPGDYLVPEWGGRLRVIAVGCGGVDARWLETGELASRSGAETFQCAAGAVARSLKKQFQAVGLPESERPSGKQLPLLYSQGRLIYVPGLGLDARAVSGSADTPSALRRDVLWIADKLN